MAVYINDTVNTDTDCETPIPKVCGRQKVHMPTASCDTIHFTGVDDAEINQGQDFDPTEGVHAYDGNGEEIPFTVEPSEVDECQVGEIELEYTATGVGKKLLPKLCGSPNLKLPYCGVERKRLKRNLVIKGIAPPSIRGIERVCLDRETLFNPMDGVSAVDGNGNTLEVSHSGTYDEVASGEIASFESIGGNSKSLKVALEPIQDLNGYDKPWAGGAGRNLLNVGGRVNQTSAKVRYTSDDNYIILNGTKNGGGYATMGNLTLTLPAGTYYAKAFVISGTSTGTIDVYVNNGTADITGSLIGSSERTITLESETTLRFRFAVWNDGTVLTNYTVGIVVSKTSGIDKFYPYSNICPISGHTEVDTHRTGKNLLTPDASKWSSVGTYQHINDVLPTETTARMTFTDKDTSVSIAGLYIGWVYEDVTDASPGYYNWCIENGTKKTNTANESTNRVADVRICRNIFIYPNTEDAFNRLFARYDIMVELGSTATSYEPYQGTTYHTELGRTVYGGTLDIVSGELAVDRAMVDLGSLTWAYSSDYTRFFAKLTGKKPYLSATDYAQLTCSSYPFSGAAGLGGNMYDKTIANRASTSDNDVLVKDTSYTNVDTFKQAMNGVTLVYELATPQTYQLTPQEVTLLVGNNNVWSDGMVTVAYPTNIPDGAYNYPFDGAYEITYHAEDRCGNETTEVRQVIVSKSNSVCGARVCCATVAC